MHAEFCHHDLVFDGTDDNGKPLFRCPGGGLATGTAVGTAANANFVPNDALSGVILSYYDPLVRPAATVYSGTDCTGRSAALYTNGVEDSSSVNYSLADMQ